MSNRNSKNRMCFKIISFILIQAFVLLHTAGMGDMASYAAEIDTGYLAPSIMLDDISLQKIFVQFAEPGLEADDLFAPADDEHIENRIDEEVDETKADADVSESNSVPSKGQDSSSDNAGLSDTVNPGTEGPEWGPPWPPPQPGDSQLGNNTLSFALLWNKDEMVKILEDTYGLLLDINEFSRLDLWRLLKAMDALRDKDGKFRGRLALLAPLKVKRASFYMHEGRKDKYQLAKIMRIDNEVVLMFYQPFFSRSFGRPQALDMRKEALRQIIGDYALATLIIYPQEGKGDEHPVLSFYPILEGAADEPSQAELDRLGITLAMYKIMLYLAGKIKKYKDPDPEHQWEKGFADVEIKVASLFASNVFSNSLRVAGIDPDKMDDKKRAGIFYDLNHWAREKRLTEVDYVLISDAFAKHDVYISDEQKKKLVVAINRSIEALQDERRFWLVLEKEREDGKGTDTVLSVFNKILPFLYNLAEDCRKYPNARIWQNPEGKMVTLLDLLFEANVLPHEGGRHGHAMRIPVRKKDNGALSIPWQEFEKITDKEAREKAFIEFFVKLSRREWPQAIIDVLTKGPYYWVSAATAINKALTKKGYNSYEPGPYTQGIVKEVHANAGVMQVASLMGIALGRWFMDVYCASEEELGSVDPDVTGYLQRRCTFLTAVQRNEVKRLIQKIDTKHRENSGQRPRKLDFWFEGEGIFGEEVKMDDSSGLRGKVVGGRWGSLGIFAFLPHFTHKIADAGTVPVAEQLPADIAGAVNPFTEQLAMLGSALPNNIWFYIGVALVAAIPIGVGIVRYIRHRNSPEGKTIRLARQAVRKRDISGLLNFYYESKQETKNIILNTVGRLAREKKIDQKVFTAFFIRAFDENADLVLERMHERIVALWLDQLANCRDIEAAVKAALRDMNSTLLALNFDRDPRRIAQHIARLLEKGKLTQDTFRMAVSRDSELEVLMRSMQREKRRSMINKLYIHITTNMFSLQATNGRLAEAVRGALDDYSRAKSIANLNTEEFALELSMYVTRMALNNNLHEREDFVDGFNGLVERSNNPELKGFYRQRGAEIYAAIINKLLTDTYEKDVDPLKQPVTELLRVACAELAPDIDKEDVAAKLFTTCVTLAEQQNFHDRTKFVGHGTILLGSLVQQHIIESEEALSRILGDIHAALINNIVIRQAFSAVFETTKEELESLHLNPTPEVGKTAAELALNIIDLAVSGEIQTRRNFLGLVNKNPRLRRDIIVPYNILARESRIALSAVLKNYSEEAQPGISRRLIEAVRRYLTRDDLDPLVREQLTAALSNLDVQGRLVESKALPNSRITGLTSGAVMPSDDTALGATAVLRTRQLNAAPDVISTAEIDGADVLLVESSI